MTREDSLQNQVSHGLLHLQVNFFLFFRFWILKPQKTSRQLFFLPRSYSTKLAQRTSVFIHSKNAIKLNYRGDESCVNLFPLTANKNPNESKSVKNIEQKKPKTSLSDKKCAVSVYDPFCPPSGLD